jgi:hypothetical protein
MITLSNATRVIPIGVRTGRGSGVVNSYDPDVFQLLIQIGFRGTGSVFTRREAGCLGKAFDVFSYLTKPSRDGMLGLFRRQH